MLTFQDTNPMYRKILELDQSIINPIKRIFLPTTKISTLKFHLDPVPPLRPLYLNR